MEEKVKPVKFVRCGKICVVDPPDLSVSSGDTVEFVNSTEAALRIFFAKRDLFDAELASVGKIASVKLHVKASPPLRPVVYHYAVFCDETDSFAVGGSNPRIILNP